MPDIFSHTSLTNTTLHSPDRAPFSLRYHAFVASAYAAHLVRRAAEYGVVLDGEVRVDMHRVKARAGAVVATARAGVEKNLREMDGYTVFKGHARFEGPDRVRGGGELLTAPRIFINVGGRAFIPDMPGVGKVPFLTNRSMLELDLLPEHLASAAAATSALSSRRCTGGSAHR